MASNASMDECRMQLNAALQNSVATLGDVEVEQTFRQFYPSDVGDVGQRDYAVDKLEKDLREAAKTMGQNQVRFLVDHYYSIQEFRKSSGNQHKALSRSGEPIEVLDWFARQSKKLEKYLQITLDVYAHNHPVGEWMLGIKGIGPVLAAGILAHVDINKAPTVGHIWSFAGLDPTVVWEKGQKRPWNADLKVLAWKIGDSFVKFSGGEMPTPYGYRYKAWKALYLERNALGLYEETAKQTLASRTFRSDTETKKAYEQGKLPLGRIDLMARRKAVKLFLSHVHDFWYRHEFQKDPPAPYVIEQLRHTHFVPRPDQVEPKEWAYYFGRVPSVKGGLQDPESEAL